MKELKHIVVAGDSFKGSVTSRQFACACHRATERFDPRCRVTCLCVGDGGEGTMETVAEAMAGRYVDLEVTGPEGTPVNARYLLLPGDKAYIEMAAAAGLTLVEPLNRNPLRTGTHGVGELIMDAIGRGCREVMVGLGGSATNDGGMGMLQAMGCVFYDRDGNEIASAATGGDMLRVGSLDCSQFKRNIEGVSFTAACDVTTRFSGKDGASETFGPQKGADAGTVRSLDNAMSRLATIYRDATGVDVNDIDGTGAAGGLGGALAALAGARLISGIDMVLEMTGFDTAVADASLVVTGEGCIDWQSVQGKVTGGVLRHAAKAGVPVFALAGRVKHSPQLDEAGFAAVLSIQQGPVSLDEAMDTDEAMRNIEATLYQLLKATTAL